MPGPDGRFENRRDAGRRLAAALGAFRDAGALVLALPRGGVPVGYEVARALNAPLDIVLVRKIGVPGHPEFGLGAVVDGAEPHTVLDEELIAQMGVPQAYLASETQRQLDEIERRRSAYRGDRPPHTVGGRTVIVVDDGIATGSTVRVVLQALRRADPSRIILAVPVAPRDTLETLAADVDEIVCLETPDPFHAVGEHYADFDQTSDQEVVDLLHAAENPRPAARE